MMKSFFKPARAKAWMTSGSDNVVADLDAITQDTVNFKLNGKIHEIKPLSTKEFLVYTNALSKLWELKEKDVVGPDELIDKYYDMVYSIVPSITKEDIGSMNQQKIGALFQLILDTVSGRTQVLTRQEAQKKTLQTQ